MRKPKPSQAGPRTQPKLGGSRLESDAWHTENYREFLEYLRASFPVRFQTVQEAHVTFQCIMQAGLYWTMVKRRPFELGFCRVMAFPYRANWQSIPDMKWTSRSRWGKERVKYRLFRDAKKFMDGKLTAWNQYQPRWTLTVTPCGQFHRVATKMEKERRRKLGVVSLGAGEKGAWNKNPAWARRRLMKLVLELRREMSHRTPHAIEALLEWREAVQSPFMDFPKSGLYRERVCDGKDGLAKFRLRFNQSVSQNNPVPGGLGRNYKSSFRLGLSNAQLQSLSDLQPIPEDVRDVRPDVDKPSHGTGGTDGVSLLDAAGGKSSLEEMLA